MKKVKFGAGKPFGGKAAPFGKAKAAPFGKGGEKPKGNPFAKGKRFADGGAVQGDVRKSDRYYGEELDSAERARIRDEAVGQVNRAVKELFRPKDPNMAMDSDDAKRRRRNAGAAADNADELPGRITTGTKPYQYKAGGTVKAAKGRGDGCAVRGRTKGRIC